MVLSQAGLLVPAAYAGERASVLQEDLEKMLSDEPGKVEQARQRIYSDLASAETLAAQRQVAGRHLSTIKGVLSKAELPVDTKLYQALEKRLRAIDGTEHHPLLKPGETPRREIEHVVFVAYDQARQAIRLRQLGITPSAELSSAFVFVPRGYYTIGVPREDAERYIKHLEDIGLSNFLHGAVYSFTPAYYLDMAPEQTFLLGDFFIARTPVTHAQLKRFLDSKEGKRVGKVLDTKTAASRVYQQVLPQFIWRNGDSGASFEAHTDHYPALYTNVQTMEGYTKWIGVLLTGKEGRIPDVLERSAAARGSTRSLFSYGSAYQELWEKKGGVTISEKNYRGAWEPNYDLSRATGFESPLGARWMGIFGELAHGVKRDPYGARSRERSGTLVSPGWGRGKYNGEPGMREFADPYEPEPVNQEGTEIYQGLGFRPLIPAENFRK